LKINKRLNLVIPIFEDLPEDADEQTKEAAQPIAYVHSTPISADTFDRYYLVIAKTYAAIYSEGLGMVGGPRVADKLLKTIATDMKIWDSVGGVKMGLMEEIYRLTNVIAVNPTKGGWEPYQWGDAKKLGIISNEDASEVEAALIFFMCCSTMHRRSQVETLAGAAMKLWGARIESLDCMAFMNSLTTSTAIGTTGEKTPA